MASLAHDFQSKMESLLREDSLDTSEAKGIADWMDQHLYVNSPKTPKGQKALKEQAQKLYWWLKHGVDQSSGSKATIEDTWHHLRPHLGDLIRYFSEEGGTLIPKELQRAGHRFTNGIGADEKKLGIYADRLIAVFDEIHGWRQGALAGGVHVLLASPKDFGGGTSTGRYRSSDDTLLIRATPNVLRREGAAYAGFEYIIVHELGHRYERKHTLPVHFDTASWWTTPYSKKDGEAFAELFALTNFGITHAHTTWDPELNSRFDRLMGG